MKQLLKMLGIAVISLLMFSAGAEANREFSIQEKWSMEEGAKEFASDAKMLELTKKAKRFSDPVFNDRIKSWAESATANFGTIDSANLLDDGAKRVGSYELFVKNAHNFIGNATADQVRKFLILFAQCRLYSGNLNAEIKGTPKLDDLYIMYFLYDSSIQPLDYHYILQWFYEIQYPSPELKRFIVMLYTETPDAAYKALDYAVSDEDLAYYKKTPFIDLWIKNLTESSVGKTP